MLFEQPVVDQKLDTAHADLDRRDHDNSSGAALAEAFYAECGCGLNSYITDIDVGICLILGMWFYCSIFE